MSISATRPNRGFKPKKVNVHKRDRPTYDRLWELAKERKLFSFYLTRHGWVVYMSETAAKKGARRPDRERTYLTRDQVREMFAMNPPPTEEKVLAGMKAASKRSRANPPDVDGALNDLRDGV